MSTITSTMTSTVDVGCKDLLARVRRLFPVLQLHPRRLYHLHSLNNILLSLRINFLFPSLEYDRFSAGCLFTSLLTSLLTALLTSQSPHMILLDARSILLRLYSLL
jgi:hypothetical protein